MSDSQTGTAPDVLFPKMVVACINSEGAAEFHTCAPGVTRQQMLDGAHYGMAKDSAACNGYGEPMVAFDATDPAARQLGEVLTWL